MDRRGTDPGGPADLLRPHRPRRPRPARGGQQTAGRSSARPGPHRRRDRRRLPARGGPRGARRPGAPTARPLSSRAEHRPAQPVAGPGRAPAGAGDDRRRRLRAPFPARAGRHGGAALHHHRSPALLPAAAHLDRVRRRGLPGRRVRRRRRRHRSALDLLLRCPHRRDGRVRLHRRVDRARREGHQPRRQPPARPGQPALAGDQFRGGRCTRPRPAHQRGAVAGTRRREHHRLELPDAVRAQPGHR